MHLHHFSFLISLADAAKNERDLRGRSYHEIFFGEGKDDIFA